MLPQACMKCPQVTGNNTCFPQPCVFFNERIVPGTTANQIARPNRIRRDGKEPIRAATDLRAFLNERQNHD